MNARIPLLVLWLLAAQVLRAQSWPREFNNSQGAIMLYQPQPDAFKGNIVSGVSAFSIQPTGKKDPLFGALFFEAKLNVDRDARTYELEALTIPNIKFSGSQEGVNLDQLKTAIIAETKSWALGGSLDELLTTIEASGVDSKASEGFRNEPPKIIFTTKPTVLINIDGEPVLQDIPNAGIKRVANTPFLIFQPKDKQYYLYGGDAWFKSGTINTGWKQTGSVPAELKKLVEQNKEQSQQASQVKKTAGGTVPEIIVATTPTELVQTNGQPNYVPISGTQLLYAKNSDDNLFRDLTTQEYYLLKSGRWFTSKSLEGGWQYKPATELPADFAKIPTGSDKDIVLASVPNTAEAKDALLDARIPQTATVDRKTAGKELKVAYDGAPRFEPISGTSLQLAENADKTVMRAGSKYYVVDNGVWYEGNSYNGPWEVSTNRPAEVKDIPPASPAYNTKYVEIYDSTPDVVYVGYTPGYLGSYVYGPTVVYGTGFYYRPWLGSYYYPRPATWGFNMNYNPWSGWSIGFGFSSGPFHFGFGTGGMSFGFGVGGWFGPPIYRPPVIIPNRPWYGYNRPGYNRPGYNRPNNWGNSSGNNNWGGGNQINIGGDVNINIPGGNNIYNNKKNKDKGIASGIRDRPRPNNGNRPATREKPTPGFASRPDNNRPVTRPAITDNKREAARNKALSNNVFADREGNVFRKDKEGWAQNEGNRWTPSAPDNNRLNQLEERNRNRNRGVDRSREFRNIQSSRPAMNNRPAMSRPSPATRAGAAGKVGRRR